MQSLFALLRTLGVPEAGAWIGQGLLSCAIAAAIWAVWSNRAHDPALKAAALGAGALLATPYIYLYDMVTITIPMAFLIGLGMSRGFLRYEIAGFVTIMLLIASFPFLKLPVGLVASAILAALVLRRLRYPSAVR
jgi:arabinofuranan 3-O-arabinosyltransferase